MTKLMKMYLVLSFGNWLLGQGWLDDPKEHILFCERKSNLTLWGKLDSHGYGMA